MSWTCPYQDKSFCVKRNKECDPGKPGCVLQGAVMISDEEEKKASSKGDSKDRKDTEVD